MALLALLTIDIQIGVPDTMTKILSHQRCAVPVMVAVARTEVVFTTLAPQLLSTVISWQTQLALGERFSPPNLLNLHFPTAPFWAPMVMTTRA
jgi:hypothetical protein